MIEPYFKSWLIFKCPSMGDVAGTWGGGPNAWWGNQQRYVTYGYNSHHLAKWLGDCANSQGIGLAAVNRPAHTLAFVDSARGLTGDSDPVTSLAMNQQGFAAVNSPGDYGRVFNATDECTFWNGVKGGWDWSVPGPTPDFMGFTGPRHMNGMNVTYVDGHSKYARWQELTAGTSVAPGVADVDVVITDRDRYIWSKD